MSGRNQHDAANQAKALLTHAMPGKKKSARTHTKRAEQIARVIWCRWQVTPATWQVKHLRWYLSHSIKNRAETTRNDHWRTLEMLLARQGYLENWTPLLKGSWSRRDGQNKPLVQTGRPKKLPRNT